MLSEIKDTHQMVYVLQRAIYLCSHTHIYAQVDIYVCLVGHMGISLLLRYQQRKEITCSAHTERELLKQYFVIKIIFQASTWPNQGPL